MELVCYTFFLPEVSSSIVNAGIRAILNLFIIIFFYEKISQAQKAQKTQKA